MYHIAFWTLVLNVLIAHAFPDKSGLCTDEVVKMKANMGGDNTNLGWTLKPSNNSYSSGRDFTIELTHPDPEKRFKGILLFARAADGRYAGEWKIRRNDLFSTSRIQELCTSINKNADSALSHTSNEPKRAGGFTWVPTTGGAGPVEFRGLLVGAKKDEWMTLGPVRVNGPGSPRNIVFKRGNNSERAIRYDYVSVWLLITVVTMLFRLQF